MKWMMSTVLCNLTIYLILGSDYVAGLHFRMKKLDKCYIHLQYVLTFIPSGFCRETNSHRCGHLYQQHRPCVIHWYGELWLYLHRLPHLHTNTFVHCPILASSDTKAVIPHAVFGGHVAHHSCLCCGRSQERQVWTLFLFPYVLWISLNSSSWWV